MNHPAREVGGGGGGGSPPMHDREILKNCV